MKLLSDSFRIQTQAVSLAPGSIKYRDGNSEADHLYPPLRALERNPKEEEALNESE